MGRVPFVDRSQSLRSTLLGPWTGGWQEGARRSEECMNGSASDSTCGNASLRLVDRHTTTSTGAWLGATMSVCAPSSAAIGRATLVLHDLLAKLFEAQASLPDWTYVELCDDARSLHEQLRLAAEGLTNGAQPHARSAPSSPRGADDVAGGGGGTGRSVPMIRIEGVGLVPMASIMG